METNHAKTVGRLKLRAERSELWWVCGAVLLAAAAINLLWLGRAPLADSTEARLAEVGREFAEGGHWLVPTLNYRPHLTKPPLTNWVVAAGIRAFGPNEFGARVGNALVAALGVALVAGFGWRLGGRRVGLAAVVLYASCPLYLALSRTVSIDILLAAATTGAYWAVWEMSRPECARPRVAALAWGACLGLGALAKGHIILLMALAPTVLWVLWGKRAVLARRLAWPPAIVLFLALALPWYLYINAAFPHWLTRMLSQEFRGRMVGNQHDHALPGFSILIFLGAALPAVPLALEPFWRRIRELRASLLKEDVWSLLGLWVLAPLVVLSLPRCQRANYVMPLMPAAALMAALSWNHLAADWPGASSRQRGAAYLTAAILIVCGPAALIVYVVFSLWNKQAAIGGIALYAAGAVLMALPAAACLRDLMRGRPRAAERLAALCPLLLALLALPVCHAVKSGRSARAACEAVRSRVAPESRVLLFGNYLPSASFYLGRYLDAFKTESPDELWQDDWATTGQSREVTNREVGQWAGTKSGLWFILKQQQLRDFRGYAGRHGLSFEVDDPDRAVVLAHVTRSGVAEPPSAP